MKRKALLAYFLLLVLLLLSQMLHHRFPSYAIPFYLLSAPLLLGGRVHFRFSTRDLIAGLAVSVAVLVPFYIFFHGRVMTIRPTAGWLLYEFLGVAFAEEVFFRGFLQEAIGNNYGGVVAVSLLFSLAHLPVALFTGNVSVLLTFFPSLIMGLLYMKTANVLPPTLFHFFANVLLAGFMI
jgi:membrane protease YdiL (CAAX protease family)